MDDLGFHINRDTSNRVFIDCNENEEPETIFNAQEMGLMRDLLLSVGKKNKLHESILKKIYINSDLKIASNLLRRAHLGKIIEDLVTAIQQKKQVVLKKYFSANSKDVKDRLVEPIKFTDNYQSLAAFEIATGKNKYFNLERITSVTIRQSNFKHEAKHRFSRPDVFGFSENENNYSIDLILSLRAYVILKEEYPMTIPFLKADKKTKRYFFKATVYDLKPVTRFVLGLIEEIEVVGPPEFKKYLKEHVGKILDRKL